MKPPQPVLYLHSSNELYGSDVVLLNLVRRLDRSRFRPVVLTPTDISYEGLLGQALQQAEIEHHEVDLPVLRRRYLSPAGLPAFGRRLALARRRLRPFVRRTPPPILHSNTTAVLGGALARPFWRLPHVWHVHEIITQPVWMRRLLAWLVHHSSDHVVAISQAVADHLLADQPGLAGKLSVIYDAVDTSIYHPHHDTTTIRTQWGMKPDQVLVGVVGRISAWKGQGLFLQAFAHAYRQARQLRAVIVGGPVPGEAWRLQELQAQARALGIGDVVHWAGFRTDSPQVLAALDIVVMPSIRPEPFGMVAIEAMASERPVIATRHGGPLETVQDGVTGYLVDYVNPTEMTQALLRLTDDAPLRRRMGHQGRQRVQRFFSYEQHVEAFSALYQQMAEARG